MVICDIDALQLSVPDDYDPPLPYDNDKEYDEYLYYYTTSQPMLVLVHAVVLFTQYGLPIVPQDTTNCQRQPLSSP